MTVGKEVPKTKKKAAKAPRHATLADVARLAGVAAMTASRALNHSGYVSQSVRQGVLRAAAKLDYRPNMVARQLRSQRLSAIGVLLPDIANPFSAELVNGRKLVLTNPDTALSLLYPAAALSRRPQAFELL